MKTLLVIDDDKDLRQVLRDNLEIEDFVVFEAAFGKRMFEILEQHKVDCILLDLKLPDGYGLDFIEEIKNTINVPLLIMSGEQKKGLQAKGLNLGADDFIQKPFDIDELIARINANMRVYGNNTVNKVQKAKPGTESMLIGKWKMDHGLFQLFDKKGNSADLTYHEYLLLKKFLEDRGKVVKREDLCELFKKDSYIPTHRAIDIKISRIRKKLGGEAEFIKTIRNIGYIFS